MSVFRLLLITVALSFAECSGSSLKMKEITISRKYISDCETGTGKCDPIKEKIKNGEILVINLPGGGTETEIRIDGPYGISEKLHDFNVDEFHFKITKSGEYIFRYLSCGLGGSFIIKVDYED